MSIAVYSLHDSSLREAAAQSRHRRKEMSWEALRFHPARPACRSS